MTPTTPAIFRLPLELRQQIYSYLLPRENVSHPLPSVGITSVSHRPPAAALLNIHPIIADELLDFFYTISTWKLIFSHAFNFFRVDPDLRRLQQSPSLSRLRRVEVVFYCDILLLKEYHTIGLGSFCDEIRRRADRACDVLLQAAQLKSVTVSWIDTTGTGGWTEKAKILTPLRKLSGMVTFRVGEVNGPSDVDRDSFVAAMENILGEKNLERGRWDWKGDEREPSRLRMLAFDVRQDRHLYQSGGKATAGTSGWPPIA